MLDGAGEGERLPRKLWASLARHALRGAGRGGDRRAAEVTWASLTDAEAERLVDELHAGAFEVEGKGEFKEEFVTAGGVALGAVRASFESKHVDGLYFAGETVDVDGRTGGFNLQFAWSSGYIAGKAIAERIVDAWRAEG